MDIKNRSGLLRSCISRAEDGKTVPSEKTLEKLARTRSGARSAFWGGQHIVDKQMADGPMVIFIQVHAEPVLGEASAVAIAADEAFLLAGVPRLHGPAVALFGGPAQSKIGPRQN